MHCRCTDGRWEERDTGEMGWQGYRRGYGIGQGRAGFGRKLREIREGRGEKKNRDRSESSAVKCKQFNFPQIDT